MLKGYKTIIFNVIMTGIMMANAIGGFNIPEDLDVAGAIDTVEAALVVIWGVGNFILRIVTTSPIFKGEDDAQ